VKRLIEKDRARLSKAAQKRLDRAQEQMTRELGARWKEPIEDPERLAQIMGSGFGATGAPLQKTGRYITFAARAPAMAVAVVPKLPDPKCARCGHRQSLHGNPKARHLPERCCHSLRSDGCDCHIFKKKVRR
jgi:hypothetical protein